MTTEQFETFDEHEAEAWVAARFRQFVGHGFPPELALLFAVHPEVGAPSEAEAAPATAA